MPRANKIVLMIRVCLAILVVTVSILVFGPFGGAETHFGLTDKEAHAAAFFTLTALSLIAMPRLRKWDIALVCLAFGGAIEVIQPFVGRDGDIFDFLADGLGVALCVGPMTFESLRAYARKDAKKPERRRKRYHASLPLKYIDKTEV